MISSLAVCSALAVADVEHYEEAGEGGTRRSDHQDGRGVRRRVSVVPVVVQNHTEEDQGSYKYNLCRVRKKKRTKISASDPGFFRFGEGGWRCGVALWCHEVADQRGMGAREQCPLALKK